MNRGPQKFSDALTKERETEREQRRSKEMADIVVVGDVVSFKFSVLELIVDLVVLFWTAQTGE